MLLPLAVGVLLIGAGKALGEVVQTTDTEYWGGWVTRATYYEPWDERVSCRHPRYRTEQRTRTVSDGKGGSRSESYTEQVQDGYEHLYDVDYHGPRWEAENSNDERLDLSRAQFEQLAGQWGNRTFRELQRPYHSVDGDAFDTTFPGDEAQLVPTKTTHSYENRVQASSSVFNYPEVSTADRKRYGLFPYPAFEPLRGPAVLPSGVYAGEANLQRTNALLGASRQVCVWVLVFTGQPLEAGLKQEALWKRGNKNELVICVGLSPNQWIAWAHVFSWAKDEALKVEIRNQLLAQGKLDLAALNDWLRPELQRRWKRREFREFSYLSVEPPAWMVALTYVLVLAATGGLCGWSLLNEHRGRQA